MGVYYLRSEGATWDRLYEWEPYEYCQATGNATRQAHVLGGCVPGRQRLFSPQLLSCGLLLAARQSQVC